MPVGRDDPGLISLAAAVFDGNSGDLGVAVSGGSDSVALLHLVAAARPAGVRLAAITINHDLRPEAAQEACFVGEICAGLGIEHSVLVWDHGVIAGNLPDMARRARYGLIAHWARGRGLARVMLGHTADDQAETVVMGLARGAGLDGLCGMRAFWMHEGVRFERPLLVAGRAALRGYLTRSGVAWVDDPTNDDMQYQRVKARKALAVLRPLGITVAGLGAVAHNLAAARRALVAGVADAAGAHAREEAGAVRIDRAGMRAMSDETTRRLLIAALRWVSGAAHAPRADAVLRLQHAIRQGRDATLWGCRIRMMQTELCITREPRAVASLTCPPHQLWDARWRLEGPSEPGLDVRALSASGLRACKDWRGIGISRDALVVSPAVWRGETLIAAPLAGFSNGWTARIDAGFTSFIISH